MKEFPKPISYKKLFGPSFIILALGLGSGEVILWPYLASNYGLGIAWGAILGITFQFFINMEIERYALVKGESVFVGIAKLFPWATYWFIFSTFIGFGLPGIIAASAQVASAVLGIEQVRWVAMAMLVGIGVMLSVGKTVYGFMERVTKAIILLGVPCIFLLAIMMSTQADWHALAVGLVGRGDGFWLLPAGIPLATFLAAFAYSGAGGNLNLTQSIYVKEKGYGMGKYAQKIVGLFQQKEKQRIKLTGEEFAITPENIIRYKTWWRMMNLEHAVVFLLVGCISILLLMLLSFATTFGLGDTATGITFVLHEGRIIGEMLSPILGTFFLVVVAVMLFQTQLGVLDSTSRIMAENVTIAQLRKNPQSKMNLSRVYAYFVWAQIAFGIVLFLCNIYEPKTLIVAGAVLNAMAMFVHIGLVSWLNYKSLPKVFQPSLMRRIILAGTFLFFGFFSVMVVWEKLG
jgi:hypothetical protein